MIFNIPTGGKRTAMCYFRGAVSETLTITQDDTTVATVSTGTDGLTSPAIELKKGTYTVKGSVSGYSRTVTVKDDGTYNAHPDGAIYWYGTEVYAVTAATGGTGGSYSHTKNATKETNHIYLRCITRGDAGSTIYAQVVTSAAVDTSKYSTIKIQTTLNTSGAYTYGFTGGYKASTSVGNFGSRISVGTASITSPGTSVHIGCTVYATTYGPVYSQYGVNVQAIWLDGVIEESEDSGTEDDSNVEYGEETLAGSNSIAVSSTYRYSTANESLGWSAPSNFGQSENYFGYKTSSYNEALIPVGSFSFTGRSTRLQLSFYGHRPSTDFTTFRWAICSSDANKAKYQQQTGAVSDSYQLAAGIGTLADYPGGAYSDFTFDFESTALSSDTALYVYLWPSGKTGVAHISGTITASLYYQPEVTEQ